jgi:hypothetical protein
MTVATPLLTAVEVKPPRSVWVVDEVIGADVAGFDEVEDGTVVVDV